MISNPLRNLCEQEKGVQIQGKKRSEKLGEELALVDLKVSVQRLHSSPSVKKHYVINFCYKYKMSLLFRNNQFVCAQEHYTGSNDKNNLC